MDLLFTVSSEQCSGKVIRRRCCQQPLGKISAMVGLFVVVVLNDNLHILNILNKNNTSSQFLERGDSWVVTKKASTLTDASRSRKKYAAVIHGISFCSAAVFHSLN